MNVTLHIDGKRIPMNKFVQSIVRDVNLAIISNLKGVEEWNAIEIRIERSSKKLEE
ncbi:hypothetical protein [Archaeoglobus profundus]|uniref:Uncharacterized protein n=1 Tax=Archaeoglobus profundus (strain DSM 5631 / JCM 9629 / NBRC 100127 / Av18) TaxID=572546 RepID=D2RDV3_ARCPA|nr:hypothetical protein [Archaeoglobus profundus]ADB58297.1 hypothetical protein Arcpr_1245 [Archaeoglobus profundus DSM 5631]